jgi:hypothetical protein
LEIGFHFFLRLTWTAILFALLTITGMTEGYHHTQLFSVEMEALHFFPDWPGTMILLISASYLT